MASVQDWQGSLLEAVKPPLQMVYAVDQFSVDALKGVEFANQAPDHFGHGYIARGADLFGIFLQQLSSARFSVRVVFVPIRLHFLAEDNEFGGVCIKAFSGRNIPVRVGPVALEPLNIVRGFRAANLLANQECAILDVSWSSH
jgi:hypothetical protein